MLKSNVSVFSYIKEEMKRRRREEEEISGFLIALKTLGLPESQIESQLEVFVENPDLREKLRAVVRETLRDRIAKLESKQQNDKMGRRRRRRKDEGEGKKQKRLKRVLPPVRQKRPGIGSRLYNDAKRRQEIEFLRKKEIEDRIQDVKVRKAKAKVASPSQIHSRLFADAERRETELIKKRRGQSTIVKFKANPIPHTSKIEFDHEDKEFYSEIESFLGRAGPRDISRVHKCFQAKLALRDRDERLSQYEIFERQLTMTPAVPLTPSKIQEALSFDVFRDKARKIRRKRCARRIQSCWRRSQERARYWNIRICLIKIQRCVRVFCQRVMRERHQEASTKIQAQWRGYLKRVRFRCCCDSVRAVQRVARVHLIRIGAACRLQTWFLRIRRDVIRRGATTIQRYMRGIRDRRRVSRKVHSVSKLQAWIRGKSKKRAYLEIRAASLRLQKWLRSNQRYHRNERMYQYTQDMAKRLQRWLKHQSHHRRRRHREVRSATMLQVCWRKYRDRLNVRDMMLRKEALRRENGAQKIQTFWRSCRDRQLYIAKKIKHENLKRIHLENLQKYRETRAAKIVQSYWKQYNHSKHICVRTIQAQWRGCRERSKYNELLLQREKACILIQSKLRQVFSTRNTKMRKTALQTLQAYAFMSSHHTKINAAKHIQHAWTHYYLQSHRTINQRQATSIRQNIRKDFDSRRNVALNRLREKRIELGLEKRKKSPRLLDRVTPELRKQIETHIKEQIQTQMAAFYKLVNRSKTSIPSSSASPYQISPTSKPIVSMPSRRVHR